MGLGDRVAADRPLLKHLGIRVEPAGSQGLELSLEVRPVMVNAQGFCHGGMLFVLADTACAYALAAAGAAPATVDASISYLRPALLGDRVLARAQVRRSGRRFGHCDVTLEDSAGRPLALYRGTCANLEDQSR
ncbi:MAG: PaaI family thioesterase [Pseudomonadales bacterium]